MIELKITAIETTLPQEELTKKLTGYSEVIGHPVEVHCYPKTKTATLTCVLTECEFLNFRDDGRLEELQSALDDYNFNYVGSFLILTTINTENNILFDHLIA